MLRILGRRDSSNVQKVVWCCSELGLAFEREDIGGKFGKNKEQAYLAVNPNGLVPTLQDGAFVLWESNSNLPIDRSSLPQVEGWYQRLCERPAFKEHVMIPLI